MDCTHDGEGGTHTGMAAKHAGNSRWQGKASTLYTQTSALRIWCAGFTCIHNTSAKEYTFSSSCVIIYEC